MNKTSIEYLDFTWNPIAMRCSRVSSGCTNCWHLTMANRLASNKAFAPDVRAAYAGDGPPVLVDKRLLEGPLMRQIPARIGVQFMGDLFHKDIDFDTIGDVWQVMYECPQHLFEILTKRPLRMQQLLSEYWIPATDYSLPLPNVWLGVSAEDQATADERIPILLQTPATGRFVSCEPLLGPVNAENWLFPVIGGDSTLLRIVRPYLNWLVIGCESGPRRRPCKLEWVRSLVEQGQAAGVPVFVKQLDLDGRVSHDPTEWPSDLRVREFPT